MNEPIADKVNIFLTVDMHTIKDYFNSHDPAPIYKRQLSNQLQEYIRGAAASVKRNTVVFYKFKCNSEKDREYTQPLIYAIRRHYSFEKDCRIKDFKRFKVQTWTLLAVSLVVVLIIHGFLPMLITTENQIVMGLLNSVDIFSWVLLWRPIDSLLFSWNPHLKDISVLNKLATSELIIVENDK